MKHILYKFLLITALLATSSCDLTNLDLLDDPNAVKPDNADVNLYFNRVQIDFAAFFQVVSNSTMPAVRMTAMTTGNIYDNAWQAESFNTHWFAAYAQLLPDMRETIRLATEQELFVHVGATKIMQAYMLMTLVDLFGEVPFSQTGQGLANDNPSADADVAVYAQALTLLNESVDDLSKTPRGTPSSDLIYGSDGSKWIKLANTLKLKYYLNTRLINTDASANVKTLLDAGGLIETSDDDFQFQYGSQRANPDSRHPYYDEHYEANNGRYMSNYFMWSLREEKSVEDPRLRYYFYRQDLDATNEDQFTLDCVTNRVDGVAQNFSNRPGHYGNQQPWCLATNSNNPADAKGYWGREHGNNDGIPPDGAKRTVFGIYPGGGKYDDGSGLNVKNNGADGAGGDGIGPFMLSSFVHFMRAEAALVLNTGESARDLLLSGVSSSIQKVMTYSDEIGDVTNVPTDSVINLYTDAVLALYDGASNDADRLNVIMKEYHIALWGNGIEAYNAYRRTGLPNNLQPTREVNSGNFPRSMLYPADYVNLNSKAEQKVITKQVFWDNNPVNFID